MRKLIMALAIAATIVACQTEQKTNGSVDSTISTDQPIDDSLTYRYDSIKVYSKNPVSKDARVTDTAKAVISYPVFSDTIVNNFLKKKITGMTDGEKSYSTYESYGKGFINGFDDFQKDNKDRIQTWFLSIGTKVIRQQPSYLSFYTTYINFAGGAHPNSSFTYQNYNPETHQEITLDELLLPGSRPKLNEIAEKVFRANEKLSPAQSLKGLYFFENDVFKLNDNFTVTEEGLLFLYNPYEIKAYAFGVTKLLIPFKQLQGIAKPNSLLSVK